jgi:hypothetical protein
VLLGHNASTVDCVLKNNSLISFVCLSDPTVDSSALNFRVYNVIFEKGTANAVIDQINIFKAIGSGAIFTAYAAPFNVTVSDGELNIEFVAIQSDPSVCGIEIVPKAG